MILILYGKYYTPKVLCRNDGKIISLWKVFYRFLKKYSRKTDCTEPYGSKKNPADRITRPAERSALPVKSAGLITKPNSLVKQAKFSYNKIISRFYRRNGRGYIQATKFFRERSPIISPASARFPSDVCTLTACNRQGFCAASSTKYSDLLCWRYQFAPLSAFYSRFPAFSSPPSVSVPPRPLL